MKFLTSLRQRLRSFLAGALVLACAAAVLLLRRIKRLLSLARRFWPALACALVLVCAAVLLSGGRQAGAMASRIRTRAMPSGDRPKQVCEVILEGEGWTIRDGLLFRVEENQIPDGQFYTLDEHGLVPAETHRLLRSGQFRGHSYELDLLWARGTEGVVCWDNAQPGSACWFTRKVCPIDISGQRSTAALTWYLGNQNFPMLIQLETGEMADPLERFSPEERESLNVTRYFPDLKHALAFREMDGPAWVLDLEAGTKTALPEEIPLCCSAFWTPDAGTLMAAFTDPDLLTDCWTYDVSSGAAARTVEREELAPCKADTRYGLVLEEDGSLSAADLRTGGRAPVEDFTYAWGPRYEYGCFRSSPAGDRLLYLRGAPGASESDRPLSEPGLGQLGILDPGRGTFVLWEMEDWGDLYWDERTGWLDEKRVFLWSSWRSGASREGEGGPPDRHRVRVYSL